MIGFGKKAKFSNYTHCKKATNAKSRKYFSVLQKQPIYNPQMTRETLQTRKTEKKDNGSNNGDAIGTKKAIDNEGYERYPSSVQIFSNGNNKTEHPTQKPLELMKYLYPLTQMKTIWF
jgi:DNA modification methylase